MPTISNDQLLQWIQATQAQEPVDWTAVYRSCDPFLRTLCRESPWTWYTWDDVFQEVRLSLYQAFMTYDSTFGVPPQAFIRLVVRRKLTNLYRYYFRPNRTVLIQPLSWNQAIFSDEPAHTLADIVADPQHGDPSDRLIARETLDNLWRQWERILTDLEWQVLMAFVQSASLTVTATQLHRSRKSIDNALQRIRRKLRPTLFSG